ncbi:glycosyltransferase involved in cell wall biosynthesis [Catenuloplanes nepalensis]|uniref:Glycosyltransferase involved in cell wall biosynthesis n=1 Tax=Catenuloplanes nepalensis TaxID=587533 RepID=A0ABT9MQE0_9ACTN|nr:glycosyltransferase family 4 protein [Catenuloplanes nepalensis]MDP9793646.1 glycosyltransferase involved in cell wall biosynthesis [Catenuloplanes nepalensis]
MRIAHVTDVYLPRLGGVELQVRDLAGRQAAAGHAPIVVTATPGFLSGNPPIPVVRVGGAGVGPYRAVRDQDLCRVLREQRAEAVHAHVSAFSPLAWSAARLAGAHGVPTVVSVHSMWHDVIPIMRWYARRRGAARWPVEWAAVSTAAAAAVRDALDGTPVAVLPNGIDPAAWLTPPAPRDGPPTVVSVMRMVRRKRPRPLLHALFALHRAHPGRFRAVLVGDGPLLPRLRSDVAAAGLNSGIRLTGALPRHDIRALLAGADLYVAPAHRESFGIAALEARCAGLPVVARSGSGVADFVEHGVDGWLVGSDTELVSTVSGLLAAPGLLAEVARHNRAVVPRLHWDIVLTAAAARYAAAARLQSAPVRV